MGLSGDLRAAAEAWAAIDTEHGAAITELLRERPDDVSELFDGRIAFGTAGLRAAMGPGPKQMNRLVVRQTTAGLMNWLPSGATVVIGYDARFGSQRFAHDVAAVVLDRGGRALLVDRPAPTPVTALAVLDREADAGIVITASHNPATDNGYKLYLADGIQLVPPADAEIAAAIDRVATVDPLPMGPEPQGPPDGAVDIAEEAMARHRAVAQAPLTGEDRDVTVLYTAMHGVGGRHLLDCFVEAGFPEPLVVAEQFEPDPTFPTAAFPNPEEAGALDLALAEAAASVGGDRPIDVILANDPDADRLAVATPGADGTWSRLSGDEVGALLADHVLRAAAGDEGPAVVASSIVSSRFIDRLAAAAGVDSLRTLTGFKWVARAIVERPDHRYLLGYEEALGYCVGHRVRDKDGISAALVMAELVARCKAEGSSLRGRLDELALANGLYVTGQVTVRLDRLDAEQRQRVMAGSVTIEPAEVAGVAVTGREDLSEGRHLPPTAGVVLDLADGSRIIVRPSGTEPKIKAYLEVVEDPVGPAGITAARDATSRRLADLATAIEALLLGSG